MVNIITLQKMHSKVKILINTENDLEVIALINTGIEYCIQELRNNSYKILWKN